MTRTCLVIIDGAGYDTVVAECGFLQASYEAGKADRREMRTCLPTISAAMYETIHTGLAPVDHGIHGNDELRPSRCENLFSALHAAGRTAGVVAHSYYHTLYGGSAFDPFEHAEINDPSQPIAHARYYTMEGYAPPNPCHPAEIDLCAQAWKIAQSYEPDYLLLHSCSADTFGHFFTGDSAEYRRQVWMVDNALSRLIPRLRDIGYDVMVTADHGMNSDGHHGGDQAVLRRVALYSFGAKICAGDGDILDQRALAPSILKNIGVSAPGSMTVPPFL